MITLVYRLSRMITGQGTGTFQYYSFPMPKEQKWWDEPNRVQNTHTSKESWDSFKALLILVVVGAIAIILLVYFVILVLPPIVGFLYSLFQSGPSTGPNGVCDYRTMMGDC